MLGKMENVLQKILILLLHIWLEVWFYKILNASCIFKPIIFSEHH